MGNTTTRGASPETIENPNALVRGVLGALDRAVAKQSGTVIRYVESLRRRHPEASPAELQAIIDKHFLNLVSGTGAAAGASAAVPGIGLVTGAAAVGAESLVFLEAAAWYVLASAHLRGDDITAEERRRALVLLVLTGAQGTAVVDTLVGDLGTMSGVTSAATLARFSSPAVAGLNKRLTRAFVKQITKRFQWAWLSKMLPLGIGAVLGTSANRKLARSVIAHAREQLSPLSAGADTHP